MLVILMHLSKVSMTIVFSSDIWVVQRLREGAPMHGYLAFPRGTSPGAGWGQMWYMCIAGTYFA